MHWALLTLSRLSPSLVQPLCHLGILVGTERGLVLIMDLPLPTSTSAISTLMILVWGVKLTGLLNKMCQSLC
jgi:hypothetical protein